MAEIKFVKSDINVPSTDGKHTLRGVIYVPQTDEVRGKVEVIHGMTEYVARYDKFMSELANEGYIVYGYDHVGHGRTADSDDELGFIASENGYDILINDVKAFADDIEGKYPGYKRILFGHSMGSFITRLAVTRYPDLADMYICSGTGGPNPAAGIGLFLAKLIGKIKGERHISKTIYSLAFGAYNKKTEKKTQYDWISHDENILNAYVNDKYCTFKFTVSAMADLVYMNKACNEKNWFASVKRDMPIMLVAGEEDPVGDYGKGVEKVYSMLKDAGVTDVTLKIFPGNRHEVLNDSGHAKLVSDILEWIKK